MSTPTVGNGVFAPVAGQPDPRGPADSQFTRTDYATAVLQRKGWPVTQGNIQFLLNLAEREHASSNKSIGAAFNLFDSEEPMPGSSFFNHTSANAGVQNYTSFGQGVDAAVATLTNGNYPNIEQALASGDAEQWDAQGKLTPDLRTWSGGAYGTVSNVKGQGSTPVSGDATQIAAETSGGVGMSLNDVMLTYAPELAKEMADPEIKDLLNRLDAGLNGGPNGLSVTAFETQLEQTNWWKTTPQSQRTILANQATDPATAAQTLTNQQRSVLTLAQQMGVPVDDAQAYSIALTSIKDQWSTDQIKQNIANRYTVGASTAQGGEAGSDLQQLKDLYSAYALPAGNDASLQGQLQQVLSGKTTVAEFGAQLAKQAQSLYGANADLASALGRGETVRQYMQPYANMASQRLGIDPTQVDWTDPKWNAALTGTTDPTTGRTTPMSLMQWQKNLMTNPVYGWASSQDGISQATAGAQVIAKGLGLNVP